MPFNLSLLDEDSTGFDLSILDEPDVINPPTAEDNMRDAVYTMLIQTGLSDIARPSSTGVNLNNLLAEMKNGRKPWEEDRNLADWLEDTIKNIPGGVRSVYKSMHRSQGMVPQVVGPYEWNIQDVLAETEGQPLTHRMDKVIEAATGKRDVEGLWEMGKAIMSQPAEAIRDMPAETAMIGVAAVSLFSGGLWGLKKIRGRKPTGLRPVTPEELSKMSPGEVRSSARMNVDEEFAGLIGTKEATDNWLATAPLEEVKFLASGGQTGVIPKLAFIKFRDKWLKILDSEYMFDPANNVFDLPTEKMYGPAARGEGPLMLPPGTGQGLEVGAGVKISFPGEVKGPGRQIAGEGFTTRPVDKSRSLTAAQDKTMGAEMDRWLLEDNLPDLAGLPRNQQEFLRGLRSKAKIMAAKRTDDIPYPGAIFDELPQNEQAFLMELAQKNRDARTYWPQESPMPTVATGKYRKAMDIDRPVENIGKGRFRPEKGAKQETGMVPLEDLDTDVPVPAFFTQYPGYKDVLVRGISGKPSHYFLAEIDGSLPVEAKLDLPNQMGPTEQFVGARTRDLLELAMQWDNEQTVHLNDIFKGMKKKDRRKAWEVLQKVDVEQAAMDTGKLAGQLKADPKIVKVAQQTRLWLERVFHEQNVGRALRGQNLIKHREMYAPDKLRDATIREEMFGWDKETPDIMNLHGQDPPLPDYIHPTKTFTPHELQKIGKLNIDMKETDLRVLMERYAKTAMRDIYYNSIIKNNKAFVKTLNEMGYKNSARAIADWTAESFAGVRGQLDRMLHVSPRIDRALARYSKGLNMGVFPLNVAWNITIQPLSTANSIQRHGLFNHARGAVRLWTDPKFRQEIRGSYAWKTKAQKIGQVTQQDVAGMGKAIDLDRGIIDNTLDAFNYFTEMTERRLSELSGAAAHIDGHNLGLRGEALRNYVSDGIFKSQSDYSRAGLPSILRNRSARAATPWQTFAFEVFNNMREIAGKTGTPKATRMKRVKQGLKFFATLTASNMVIQEITGRKPWEMASFVPMYNLIYEGSREVWGQLSYDPHKQKMMDSQGLTPGVTIAADGAKAMRHMISTGEWDPLRRWLIRNASVLLHVGSFGRLKVPGTTQINRIVDAHIDVSRGGRYDKSGEDIVFPITETKDKIRAYWSGSWSTGPGQEEAKKFRHGYPLVSPEIYNFPGVSSVPILSDLFIEGEGSYKNNLKKLYGN